MNISKIKEWLKVNRNKIIGVAFVLLVLTVAFLSGEKPASSGNSKDNKSIESELQSSATSDKAENRHNVKNSSSDKHNDKSGNNQTDSKEEKDNKSNTDVSDSNSEAQDTSAYNDNSKADNQNGEQNPGSHGNTSSDADNSAGAESDSNKTDISSPGTNISDGSNEQNTNGNSNTSTSNNSGNNQNGNTNSNTGSNSDKNENTCTISISCATILNNMSKLDKDKKDIVPKDGWILKEKKVTFKEGESVFDILQRVCKDNKIHMEASFTPLYNSSYIEGIYNLYEFDCGSLSGWMYSVNGVFPNYGCSQYIVKKGDVIRWQYTCDLGKDVGGGMN
ncbi:MAG: DUF4430 domain-containing protein [Lachnospiraceae bacterium]|nr:DUF4430 domain-containing protein [Lachnospiraceae bacterium]